MKDITQYSNQELSDIFMNYESLYNEFMGAVRRDNFQHVKFICDESFIYTPEQLDDLKETFESEVQEYNK